MERIEQLLEAVNLKGFEHRCPRELSGGMQRRAWMARSLAVIPSVLLMDEPFGALDVFTRDEMNLLIQEIWLETRKTIAFVTHSISEAIFLADRVVLMSARPGRISAVYDIDIPRPRPVEIQTQPDFIRRVLEIKARIDRGRSGAAALAGCLGVVGGALFTREPGGGGYLGEDTPHSTPKAGRAAGGSAGCGISGHVAR